MDADKLPCAQRCQLPACKQLTVCEFEQQDYEEHIFEHLRLKWSHRQAVLARRRGCPDVAWTLERTRVGDRKSAEHMDSRESACGYLLPCWHE